MKVAFVSGPYRDARGPHYIGENIAAARKVAVHLWQMGLAVVCPHLNTAFMDGAAPDDVWLAGDLEMLRRCDLVVMVPGWAGSSGARNERSLAVSLDIPVFEFDSADDMGRLAQWLCSPQRKRAPLGGFSCDAEALRAG